MKKALFTMLFLLLALALPLSACNDKSASQTAPKTEDTAKVDTKQDEPKNNAPVEPDEMATLYADMSGGDPNAPSEAIRQVELGYSGELTPERLAKGLSDLTGLNFDVKISKTTDGFIVDWTTKSTLLGGDVLETKEDYSFFDVDTMACFMLDSLWTTLVKNFNVENVYYTMDGGKELTIPNVSTNYVLPVDVPYMGTAFYAAHSDVQ